MNVEYASRYTDDVAFTRALERDVSRRAVEGAKKRAAGQRCNYDAFHQLVLGAELRAMKPLNATIENRKGARVRRRSIDVTSTTRAHCGEVNWALTVAAPRNADEFSASGDVTAVMTTGGRLNSCSISHWTCSRSYLR